MSLKRSIRMLSSSERQLLKTQWLRSGQCARCFHASIRQRAEESNAADQGTPQNAPKRGPTRHERSAQISNELQMLQKGPPPSGELTGSGSVTGAYHAPPQAPTSSVGFLETPNDMGGPRMGENVSAGREGPNAQGVGRPIRYEDRGETPQDTTMLARGARATESVEEPAEGGASVLGGDRPNQGHHQSWIKRSARQQEDHDLDRPWNHSQATKLQSKLLSSKPLGIPVRPRQPHRNHLLHNSEGASTIASKNFLGVISDRAALLSTRTSPTQKPQMMKPKPALKNALVDKFVAGRYDSKGYFEGDKFKSNQMVLNGVAAQTMLNGSFLQRDVERVLGKVKSLLPAATIANKSVAKQ